MLINSLRFCDVMLKLYTDKTLHKDPGVSVFSASSSIIQMHFWIYWKSVKAWKLNTFKVHRCPMFTNFFFLFNFCFNLMSWFVLSNSFWNCSCFFLILKFIFFYWNIFSLFDRSYQPNLQNRKYAEQCLCIEI